jgi:hypothetical protein
MTTSCVGPWLWKKVKIKEERRSTNCAEGTVTENGSKWSKKQKRRSEVRENESLNEKIEEDRLARKMDRGQLSKRKNPPTGCFGAPHGKEGKTGWRSPENMGQVDLGF